MKIVFYNHFHNGDIFTSREYVKQIIKSMPDHTFEYRHNNNPKILQDVCPSVGVDSFLPMTERFIIGDGVLYINTWIAVYSPAKNAAEPHFYDVGIDYVSLTNMWGHIFEFLNNLYGVNLQIGRPEDYIPNINYTKFDVTRVDDFVNKHKNIVLISNGPPMSGQSFDSNMELEINTFAKMFPDISFVHTHPIKDSFYKNAFYSFDITQTRYDLIEISYLSRFAKAIIGKNSGPFIYSCVRGNLMSEDKAFVQFNRHERDSLFYSVPYKCSYTYVPPPMWTMTNTFIGYAIRKAFYNE